MIPEPNEHVTDNDLGLSRLLREIVCAKSLHQPQGVSPQLFFRFNAKSCARVAQAELNAINPERM